MLFSGNGNVSTIISENKHELLGIVLDSQLSFQDHINNQGNALGRVVSHMCLEKRK